VSARISGPVQDLGESKVIPSVRVITISQSTGVVIDVPVAKVRIHQYGLGEGSPNPRVGP